MPSVLRVQTMSTLSAASCTTSIVNLVNRRLCRRSWQIASGILLERGDTLVLLAGEGPDGLAVLRFRMAIWSNGYECYLAELYVVPKLRRTGIGRALMDGALREARQRGADTMDIGVDEPDEAARSLYESLGFSNRIGGPDGPVMYVYERDL